jgi:Putative MetA-pathway of phenol degradation
VLEAWSRVKAAQSVLVPVLFIFFGVVADAQGPRLTTDLDIVTDRPDITESSIVVPRGSLQIENGLSWTTNHTNEVIDFSETLMRFGISSRTELRIVVPNYIGGLTGPAAASGFGDIAFGIKQQLGPLSAGFDLSVIVALSLPTGADPVSSHGFDPFVKFPWARELKAGWSIGGMQSVFWYTQQDRRSLTWESTVYLEKVVTKRWDVFAEYGGDFSRWAGSKQIGHFGTAYKVTPKQQLDFHFGFGVSHAAPRRFFAVGYSFRLDKLWGH